MSQPENKPTETINYSLNNPTKIFLEYGKKYIIKVTKTDILVQYIEVPDLQFNINSAIPCLDMDGHLIRTIASTYFYSEQEQEKNVLCVGHTDTSGEIDYNFDLSELRALAVKAILTGDEETWNTIVKTKSKVEDYQRIFKTLSEKYYWNCDPGSVDNKLGPKTTNAIKWFQKSANRKYNLGLATDGIIGPKTWNAILKVYRLIMEAEGVDFSIELNFWNEFDGVIGCGESFPIEEEDKDNHYSQKNRRVEIFFLKNDIPKPLLPTIDKCRLLTKDDCIMFNKLHCTKEAVGLKSSISVRYISQSLEDVSNKKVKLKKDGNTVIGTELTTDKYGYVRWVGIEKGDYTIEFVE